MNRVAFILSIAALLMVGCGDDKDAGTNSGTGTEEEAIAIVRVIHTALADVELDQITALAQTVVIDGITVR